MPMNQAILFTGSVSSGGANQSADVMAIQRQFNSLLKLPRVQLAIDGRCGARTCGMISAFRRACLACSVPLAGWNQP
jgi:hypothetical protein